MEKSGVKRQKVTGPSKGFAVAVCRLLGMNREQLLDETQQLGICLSDQDSKSREKLRLTAAIVEKAFLSGQQKGTERGRELVVELRRLSGMCSKELLDEAGRLGIGPCDQNEKPLNRLQLIAAILEKDFSGVAEAASGEDGHVADGIANPAELISIDLIDLNDNARLTDDTDEEAAQLQESMQAMGQIHPLVLRPQQDGRYELVTGARRYATAELMGTKFVPAIIKNLDDQQALILQYEENAARRDLNVFEVGMTFARLCKDHNMQQKDIAQRFKMDETEVSRNISVDSLDSQIKGDYALLPPDSRPCKWFMYTLAIGKDRNQQLEFWKRAKQKGGFRVKQLEAWQKESAQTNGERQNKGQSKTKPVKRAKVFSFGGGGKMRIELQSLPNVKPNEAEQVISKLVSKFKEWVTCEFSCDGSTAKK